MSPKRKIATIPSSRKKYCCHEKIRRSDDIDELVYEGPVGPY
jgi:hypothetical protein